jgi:hypothetical protein
MKDREGQGKQDRQQAITYTPTKVAGFISRQTGDGRPGKTIPGNPSIILETEMTVHGQLQPSQTGNARSQEL